MSNSERVPLPEKLEAQLQAHFDRTRQHFAKLGRNAPQVIVLGGGYGRGEGGIVTKPDGEPGFFNDLDYFIFTDHPDDPLMLRALREWERVESEKLGIDVEGKYLRQSELDQTAGSMMFYDAVTAHTIVEGPQDFFQPYRALANPATIEPIEATRLLWNRGSGLLFARTDLEKGGDLSVAHRNQAKAKLALGDALLTLRGKYCTYARDRQNALREQADIDPRIVALHQEGISFKLGPTPTPQADVLMATQAELTALWLPCFLEVESARLSSRFAAPADYANYCGKLFPTTSSWRNLLLGLRDRMRRSGSLRPRSDYPRGALQRALVLLLEPEPDYSRISHIFGERVTSLQQAVMHYTKWWHYYS